MSIKYQSIKDDAGLHGKTIGHIGAGTEITVDESKEHDKWVPITGPEGLGPTWKFTNQQGWVELANTAPVSGVGRKYLLEINEDGELKITRIA